MKLCVIILAICLVVALICVALFFTQESATAYIRVARPRDNVAGPDRPNEQEIRKQYFVNFATIDDVLRRAVNDDIDPTGTRLDRIRKTSYFTGDPDATIKLLQTKLDTASVKNSNLIRISLSGADLNESTEIVNAVADALVAYIHHRSTQPRVKIIKNLTNQLDEINAKIADNQQTSDIQRLQKTATEIKLAINKFRRATSRPCLRIHAYAEIPTKP